MAVNIKLTPEQQKYVVAAVLLLGGGGFAYVRYFWLPVSEKIAETKKQIEEIEAKITKAKGQAVKLDKIKKDLAQLNADALEAERKLPKTPDLAGVIDVITALSRSSNIKIQVFSAGVSKSQAHFIETSYTLTASASYHELGRFLAAISLEERIFNVRGITYGAVDTEGKMAVTFQLVSYQYKG